MRYESATVLAAERAVEKVPTQTWCVRRSGFRPTLVPNWVDLHKRGKCELATWFLTINEASMFKSKKLSIDLFCKPKPISPFIYKVFTHNSRIKSNRIKSNILQIRYKHKQDYLIKQNEYIVIMQSYCYSIAGSISDFPAFTNYAMSFLSIVNNISKSNYLLSNYIVCRHEVWPGF